MKHVLIRRNSVAGLCVQEHMQLCLRENETERIGRVSFMNMASNYQEDSGEFIPISNKQIP